MYLVHDVDDGLRRADVAETPACHRKRLGKAADDDGTLAHFAYGGYGAELHAVVDQLTVNFVGENNEVVLLDDGHERFEVALLHDRAGGIVGERDEDRLGTRSDRLLDLRDVELELVLDETFHADRSRPRQRHKRRVTDETGFGNEHFVAGSAHCSERRVERFGRADGDDDLACRIVMHADEAVEIFADRLAQFHKSGVGGVLRLALQDAVDACLAESVRSDEIRLADAEGNAILARRGDLEKFPYARRLHISCNGVEHFCIIDHIFTSYRI